jgi:hypothetical protein
MSENITNSTENLIQNITISLSYEDLKLVLEGMEELGQKTLHAIKYKEELTDQERNETYLHLEDIWILQGSIITQKRAALGHFDINDHR